MKNISIILLVIFVFSFNSCEKAFLKKATGTDNLSIFEEYVKIVTEKYGLARSNDVDLVELADSLRVFVTEDLSPEELFDLMAEISRAMKEPHTQIGAPALGKGAFYDWTLGAPKIYNDSLAAARYYGTDVNPDMQQIMPEGSWFSIDYGLLPQDQNIGYIRISSFSVSDVTDDQIEQMMQYLSDTRGMIIDVRSNFGGFIALGARIASHFVSEPLFFGDNYVKSGPGPDDYSVTEMFLDPSGSDHTYTKPVIILHDIVSMSTGALFPLMLRPADHVTTMGYKSGGGTGEIIEGLLSNGWEWILSSSDLIDPEGKPTSFGCEPDIEVIFDADNADKDEVIERAITELQGMY